jgi:hypothetical protein
MSTQTRYKNCSIIVENQDYDIVQGKHVLAVGIASASENPLERAKLLVDADFITHALLEVRKLPPTKR